MLKGDPAKTAANMRDIYFIIFSFHLLFFYFLGLNGMLELPVGLMVKHI